MLLKILKACVPPIFIIAIRRLRSNLHRQNELFDGDDLLFTKVGWIYQYNAIPNNKDNQLTNHFMKKTYEHFYGELND